MGQGEQETLIQQWPNCVPLQVATGEFELDELGKHAPMDGE